MAYLWKDSFGDARADTLLAALKTAGQKGLTQSEILREVFQRNVKADDLTRIGAMLQQAGLLEQRLDHSRGGRPPMRWFYREPVRPDDDANPPKDDPRPNFSEHQEPNDSNDRSGASAPDAGASVVNVVAFSDSSEHAAGRRITAGGADDDAAREDAEDRAAIQDEGEDLAEF